MNYLLGTIGTLMFLGGLWAFTQSRSGTQFPIPIAAIGFIILVLLAR